MPTRDASNGMRRRRDTRLLALTYTYIYVVYLMLFTFGGFVCRDAPLLTLVDDPESTKQAPLPRMLVCRVKDHDGAVPEPFKLDEVIAIKVTLYAEGTRAA